MVRRKRSCQTCQAPFVAVANASHCSTCHAFLSPSLSLVAPPLGGSNGIDNDDYFYSSNPSKSSNNNNKQNVVDPPETVVELLHSDDNDGSSSSSETEDGASEGGDDIHCTQLLFPDENDDDDGGDDDDDDDEKEHGSRDIAVAVAAATEFGLNETPDMMMKMGGTDDDEYCGNTTGKYNDNFVTAPSSKSAAITFNSETAPDDSTVETDKAIQKMPRNGILPTTGGRNNNVHGGTGAAAAPPPPPAAITTSTTHAGDDVCFICGVSLANIKRRVDHIKRCSKKHAITGRDAKVNTDVDVFEVLVTNNNNNNNNASSLVAGSTTMTTAAAPIMNNSSVNPYTKQSSWHGDANLTLRLASTENNGTTAIGGSSTMSSSKQQQQGSEPRQLSLNSFLNNPVRNINNVLIAGARRMTKAAEVKAASLLSLSSLSSVQQQKLTGQAKLPFRGKKRRRGGSFQQPSYSSGDCPMYKKIPGTDFVCDGFHYAKSSLTKNYFLTHFHADHYGGIARTWDAGVIYCSLPTATLVTQQIGVDKKYLHPLPMNTPTVIASKGKPITVTLLDANHCPGAVMFLFQVGKRQILHVGDFRWNRDVMLQIGSPLRDFASENTILDDLFLDTTYCDPKYKLPSQSETIEAIQTLFEKELERSKQNKSGKTLHLFGAYTIGKERMYLSIAERHNMKVYVDTRRYRILSALNWPKERMALLTTNKEDACIWVVPLGDVNMKKLPEYFPMANNKPFATQYDRIIGYRPTGWSMGSKPSSSLVSSRCSGNLAIHSVPYSEHSSFPELVDCLACLKPQRIVPTVNCRKSDEQVQTLLKALREKQTTLPFAKRQ